jgi:hypothetical protein
MSEIYETTASIEFVDVDGDGYEETTLVDTDGDGCVDTVLTDVDGDGLDDIAEFDNAADGEFVADVVAIDADADGRTDVVFDDVNLDGTPDTVTRGTGEALADANPYAFPGGGDVLYDVPSAS